MLIEANREKKRKGKGSNSPGTDNSRAKKFNTI
jgi:stalled ribosome alternative rescue factor ArfA